MHGSMMIAASTIPMDADVGHNDGLCDYWCMHICTTYAPVPTTQHTVKQPIYGYIRYPTSGGTDTHVYHHTTVVTTGSLMVVP